MKAKVAKKRNVLLAVDPGVWAVVENEAKAQYRTATAQCNLILAQWVQGKRAEVGGQTDVETYVATATRARKK